MQKLAGRIRAAVTKYDMIADGDKIAVGVSGGKDSVALLAGLCALQRYYPRSFSLLAISLDPCYNNKETDYTPIHAICEQNDVPYLVKRTQIASVVFSSRAEKNPCSLCAKMRRGALDDIAKENGCNKIALGHHLDDAAETFLMNLFQNGTVGCFSPVTYMSRKDITVIRPLVLLREREITAAARRLALPVVKSRCPVDGHTNRQRTKELLFTLSRTYQDLPERITGAMTRAHINGW